MEIAPANLDHIRDLYDRGLFLQAYAASQCLGPLREWRGSAGVFAGRLAAYLGATRLCGALIMRAWRSQPTDPEALCFYAYTLRNRQGPWRAWRFVQAHELPPTDPHTRGYWHGLTAALSADFRDFESAEEWLRRADVSSPDDPWLALERADILAAQDRYDDSLACVFRSLALRPDYVPALQRAAHLLPILGRLDEALALVEDAEHRIESGGLAWQHANLLVARGRIVEAERWIDRAEEYSPLAEKEVCGGIAGLRADLARIAGDVASSIECSRSAGGPFHTAVAENLSRAAASGPVPERMQLAVPFVQQQHLTCVPASLASVSRYWGRPIDPVEMARAVTYDGTPGYKARAWVEAAGWVAREFRVTAEAAEALIARGLPFTLGSMSPTHGHEQAVVGFDGGRRTLLIQDPSHFFVTEMLVDRMVEAQLPFGPRGLLLVPPDKAAALDGLDLPDAELHDRLYALERALERHEREAAAAYLDAMEATAPDHLLVIRTRQILASYDGDVPTLLDCADAMTRRFPECIQAIKAKLWALRALGRQADAAALVEELGSRPMLAPHFIEDYAQYLSLDARLLPRSLWLADRALRLRPCEAQVLSNVADVFWRAGRRMEAFALRRFAASLDDRTEDFITLYFTTARHFRRVDEPLAWLQKRHARLGGQSSHPVRSLFWALEELGRTDEGFEALEQALAAREDGELLAYAADAHARYGRTDEAGRLLERARGRCRPSVWLRAAARLARQAGDSAGALAVWRQVVENEPLATDAHSEIAGLIASQEGRLAAIEYLRRTALAFPHHHGLHMIWYEWAWSEDADAGEGVVRRMIAINPKDAWARRELAVLLAKRRAFDDCRAELEVARDLDPRNPSWHSVAGWAANLEGRVDDARAAYQEAVRLDVNYTAAIDGLLGLPLTAPERRDDLWLVHAEIVRQVLFGHSLFSFRQNARVLLSDSEVLASLRAALDARPDLWQAWSAVVAQLRDMNQLDEAASEVDRACERFPLVHQLWLDRAHAARLRGNAAEERRSLEKALETGSGWGFVARRLSELREEDDAAGARALLEQAVARAPLDAANHAHLARLLWRTGEREAALRRIDQAIALDPKNGDFWATSTRWDREQATPERTLERARQLTSKRPGDPECWMILARLLEGPSALNERLASLDRAIAVAPHCIEAYDLKAQLLAENGRLDEATATCRPALWGARIPRELRGREAWIESVRGDVRAAVARMTPILEEEPDYFWGWARLADWRRVTEDYDGYLAAAEQLVRIAPHQPVPLGYRGDAYRRNNRDDDAKTDFLRALALDPEYIFARNVLAAMQVEHSEGAEALALLDRYPALEVDEYELDLRVRALVSLGQHAEAATHLRRMLLLPAADVEPIDRAIQCSSRDKWTRQVEKIVVELSDKPDSHPHAARHAVAIAAGRRQWTTCRRRIAALPQGSEARRFAMNEYLERIAEAHNPWALRRFVGRHRDELRRQTSLWGTVGYAFLEIRASRKALAWLADWRQRPDAQPWMLHNLAIALRRTGRRPEAREVNTAALSLPRDHTTALQSLWLALDSLVDGNTRRANELLDSLRAPRERGPFWEFLWRLATAARAVGCGEKPFRSFRTEADALVPMAVSFVRSREMVGIYRRLVWCLARRHGGEFDILWAARRCCWVTFVKVLGWV